MSPRSCYGRGAFLSVFTEHCGNEPMERQVGKHPPEVLSGKKTTPFVLPHAFREEKKGRLIRFPAAAAADLHRALDIFPFIC